MTGRSNCLNSVKVYARGMAFDSLGLELTEGKKEAKNLQTLKNSITNRNLM